MFCPSSWNSGVLLGRSRKVEDGQCREGYKADLPGSIFRHIKDKMVIGESHYALVKIKLYLANLTALHDERTGSMYKRRTVNDFRLHWDFLYLPFISRETDEMLIAEIDSVVHQKWTGLQGSETCDQWHKSCHKMHNSREWDWIWEDKAVLQKRLSGEKGQHAVWPVGWRKWLFPSRLLRLHLVSGFLVKERYWQISMKAHQVDHGLEHTEYETGWENWIWSK